MGGKALINICKRCHKHIPDGEEYCDNCVAALVREEKLNDDLDHIAYEQQYNDRESLT